MVAPRLRRYSMSSSRSAASGASGSYRPRASSSAGSIRLSATAHRGDDRHLVAVAKRSVVTVLGLVAVDPHACRGENRPELRAVDRSRRRHQLAERGGIEGVVGAARRFTRLGEQPQPDGQIAISATPSLMTASPAGLVLSNA